VPGGTREKSRGWGSLRPWGQRLQPTVSVVIPSFNRASILARALGSVFSQTHPPEEVIVVDDGSSDETERLVRTGFPEARYVWQENKGVAAARNRGARMALGRWLAFLDSDDEWLPEKLAHQLDALRAHPEFPVCHTNETWVRRGRRVNPMNKHAKFGGRIFRRCLELCVISPSSVLLRCDLLDALGGFDETLPVCEDYDLWLRICSRHPVLYLEEPLLVKYGGHADQLSRRYWGMDRFRIRALEKVLEQDGLLSQKDRRAAILALGRKIDVYAQGARKRGRLEEAARYEAVKACYLEGQGVPVS